MITRPCQGLPSAREWSRIGFLNQSPEISMKTILPLMLIALSATGCPTATRDYKYGALKDRCPQSFRLEAGDVIRVSVWKEPNHSRARVLVRPDGKISLPLIGDIPAARTTITQVSKEIQIKLKTFVPDPRVDVALISTRSYQIYVMGEVRNPGTFTPQTQVNVVQALSLAGGFSPFARKDALWVIWNSPEGEKRIPFSYTEVLKGERMKQNILLCRGDTVLVP